MNKHLRTLGLGVLLILVVSVAVHAEEEYSLRESYDLARYGTTFHPERDPQAQPVAETSGEYTLRESRAMLHYTLWQAAERGQITLPAAYQESLPGAFYDLPQDGSVQYRQPLPSWPQSAYPIMAYQPIYGYAPPMPAAVYPIDQPPLAPVMPPAARQPEPPVSVATVVAPPPAAAKPQKKPVLTAAIVASGVVRPRAKPPAAPQPEPATTTAARLAAERRLAELARQTRRARNDMLLWLGILIAFCVTTGSISVYLLKKEGRT